MVNEMYTVVHCFSKRFIIKVVVLILSQGFGHLLYKELSQRLHNVGVTNIFCWADKVSEGFWLKQASGNGNLISLFVSVFFYIINIS